MMELVIQMVFIQSLPEPKLTALEYLGVVLVLMGILLIVSSYGIIDAEKVKVTPGKTTRGIGIILAIGGGALLLAAQFTNKAVLPAPIPSTSSVTPALTTDSPGVTTTSPPTVLATAQLLAWDLGKPFAYTDSQAICMINTEAGAQSGRGEAIKISYTIPAAGGYCVWGLNLNGYDASTKKSIVFWLKGDAGGERLKLGVKDQVTPAGQEPKVILTASPAWEQVSIPLEEFPGQDLSLLENFSLSFEFNLGNGIIYIDGFAFE